MRLCESGIGQAASKCRSSRSGDKIFFRMWTDSMTGVRSSSAYLVVVAGMDGRHVFLRPILRIVAVMRTQGTTCCGLARWLTHESSEEDVNICSGVGQSGMI